MHCTRCGSQMRPTETGELVCAKTGAHLSRVAAESLQECFIDRRRIPSSSPLSFRSGGPWFCPACGVDMTVGDGSVQCPQCDRFLNEFVHALVDLNPHPAVAELPANYGSTHAMFRVAGTFDLRSRGLFVVFGEILEGELRPGMQVSVPLQGELSVSGTIASVEFVDFIAYGKGYPALTLHFADADELEIWRSIIEEGTVIKASNRGTA